MSCRARGATAIPPAALTAAPGRPRSPRRPALQSNTPYPLLYRSLIVSESMTFGRSPPWSSHTVLRSGVSAVRFNTTRAPSLLALWSHPRWMAGWPRKTCSKQRVFSSWHSKGPQNGLTVEDPIGAIRAPGGVTGDRHRAFEVPLSARTSAALRLSGSLPHAALLSRRPPLQIPPPRNSGGPASVRAQCDIRNNKIAWELIIIF